jgi:predicted TIM-barrel fold metal-dependent hydrolase
MSGDSGSGTSAVAYRGLTARSKLELRSWLSQGTAEAALEPDLAIIDAHHHLWDRPRSSTSTDASESYLVEDLLDDAVGSGHRVIATVAIECGARYRPDGPAHLAPAGEVGFLRALGEGAVAGKRGNCRVAEAAIGYADLTLGARVGELLDAEIAVGGGRLKGIRQGMPHSGYPELDRFLANSARPHLALDPTFREGFSQLAPLGLSFDAWQYHSQLADLLSLARGFPDTSIILDHAGTPLGVGPYADLRGQTLQSWRSGIAMLATCPNVTVKLGGLGMTLCGFRWHELRRPPSSTELAAMWRPYIESCIGAFGPDRCMFESNFPPDKQSCGYGQLWNAFKIITAGASDAEKRQLYSGTAARVYGISDLDEMAKPVDAPRERSGAPASDHA